MSAVYSNSVATPRNDLSKIQSTGSTQGRNTAPSLQDCRSDLFWKIHWWPISGFQRVSLLYPGFHAQVTEQHAILNPINVFFHSNVP